MEQNILNIETVSLDDKKNALVIIDQTKLPGTVKILSLKKQKDIFRAIYLLQVRGAPAIGVAAAIGVYLAALEIKASTWDEFYPAFKKAKDYLASSRPTAVNLFWALDRMDKTALDNKSLSIEALKQRLHDEAIKIRDEDILVCRNIGENALSLIKDGCGILTHCNAGQLATVKYGTALAAIHLGRERGMNFRVYTDETRPLLQGARLSAFEMSACGADTTVICDNMASQVMKNGWIDIVFVGCDHVAANGDAANKIGTSGVAILAKHYGIPFYVCAPSSTIDMSIKDGSEITIEQRKDEEVTEMWYKERMAPKDVKVYNPAFDVTDNDLITGIITEFGIARPPLHRKLKRLVIIPVVDITITPHNFSLNNPLVKVPASKSHTIRMLLIASLSEGESVIRNPLKSSDAASCLSVCRALGAEITETLALDKSIEKWTVKGLGGAQNIKRQTAPLDVGNSGTTLFLGLAIASLASYPISFTGDAQIQKRSAEPLLAALEGLGVHVSSNNGCAPITVRGPWKGGLVSLECPTSQYLSALLLASPLAGEECLTEIDVPLLNEKPYIEMTLSYLQKQIPPPYNFSHFKIKGGGKYESLCASVSGDFSSAAFPSCAAVISAAKIAGNQTVEIIGLDKNDFQGDKVFFDILARCGAFVEWKENSVVLGGGDLRGGTFDLNNTPDLLPICAVLAAYCRGQTRLLNVSHARIKETDRISVMCHELKKLGVEISELRDGLVINGGKGVRGGTVDGHGDHRVVMALAVCALGAASPITILGAEAADVTYPGFLGLL